MSGLTEDDLNNIKTRANNVIAKPRDHEPIALQLAADILMLFLDRKIKKEP